MERLPLLLFPLTLVVVLYAPLGAEELATARFEQMKSLVGEWYGENKEGAPVQASYELFSNGSALVETLEAEDHPSMVTVYHVDGDRLMMTHYCGAGNQPRMRAERLSENDSVISFAFFDATNLASSSDGHMHRLELTTPDDNRLQHAWTWKEGEEERTEVFRFTRRN